MNESRQTKNKEREKESYSARVVEAEVEPVVVFAQAVKEIEVCKSWTS